MRRTSHTSLLILILGLALLLNGCRGTREGGGKAVKATPILMMEQLEEKALNFQWLSARAKMDYNDGKQKISFTANMRMLRDSVIWLSLTGPFGIEGGRVLITPQRIQIIDRLNRKYYDEDYDYIQQYFPINLDIGDLQDILVGNMRFYDKSSLGMSKEEGFNVLNTEYTGYAVSYWLHPIDYTVHKVRLKSGMEGQELFATFDDYQETESRGSFSFKRSYHFSQEDQQLLLESNFSKVKLDDPQSFPFEPSGKYEKVD